MSDNKFPEVPFKVKFKDAILENKWLGREGFTYTVEGVNANTLFVIRGTNYHHSHFNIIEEKKMTEQKEIRYKEHKFSVELWEKYKHHPDLKVSIDGKYCYDFIVMGNKNWCVALYTHVKDGFIDSKGAGTFTLHIPATAKRIPFDPERKDAKVFVKEDYKNFGMPSEVDEWYAFADCSVACRFKGIGKEFFLQKHLEMEIEE